MWQRRWFFWMESLQITPGERRIILFLISANLVLGGYTLFGPERTIYDEAWYRPVIEEFEKRAAVLEQQESQELARYFPKQTGLRKPSTDPSPEQPPFHAGLKNLVLRPGLNTSSADAGQSAASAPDETAGGADSGEIARDLRPTDDKERELISVQTAEKNDLVRLPGIGPVTARNIIDHRNEHGPFEQLEDLLEVQGIGPVTLENISPHLTFKHPAPEPSDSNRPRNEDED